MCNHCPWHPLLEEEEVLSLSLLGAFIHSSYSMRFYFPSTQCLNDECEAKPCEAVVPFDTQKLFLSSDNGKGITKMDCKVKCERVVPAGNNLSLLAEAQIQNTKDMCGRSQG